MNAPARIPMPDAALPASTLTALPLVLAARLDQIQRGHTPASDAATGPRPALQRLQARLHKLQRQVADALAETNAALDLTHGDITKLGPPHQRLLIDRAAKSSALGLAILENCMTILGDGAPTVSPPASIGDHHG